MAKLVTNGSFYVVAAAEMGARPEMVYWDECPANFKFCSGKDGEAVYHIVYNTRDTTSSKYSKTPYLCVVSHKKNSTYPSDDVKNNGANAKWSAFSNMALIATDIMLARKILAEEIDVDNLTVRNVSAMSSDGKTTCTINGETGLLEARKAKFIDCHIGGSIFTKPLIITEDNWVEYLGIYDDKFPYLLWDKTGMNVQINYWPDLTPSSIAYTNMLNFPMTEDYVGCEAIIINMHNDSSEMQFVVTKYDKSSNSWVTYHDTLKSYHYYKLKLVDMRTVPSYGYTADNIFKKPFHWFIIEDYSLAV